MSKLKAAVSAVAHGHNPISAVHKVSTDGSSKPSRPELPLVSIPPPEPHPINTPKTPADEAIDFFHRAPVPSDPPIQVYELRLEEDGGPNKDRAV